MGNAVAREAQPVVQRLISRWLLRSRLEVTKQQVGIAPPEASPLPTPAEPLASAPITAAPIATVPPTAVVPTPAEAPLVATAPPAAVLPAEELRWYRQVGLAFVKDGGDEEPVTVGQGGVRRIVALQAGIYCLDAGRPGECTVPSIFRIHLPCCPIAPGFG